jgi:hypothetical protein
VKHVHDIFISYARQDREFATDLGDALRGSGNNVWFDATTTGHAANWEDYLRERIGKCDVFIALMSPASVANANVMSELGAAIAAGKAVIPVVPTNGRLPPGLPGPLRKWQFIRSGKRGADEIAAEIGERMDKPTTV